MPAKPEIVIKYMGGTTPLQGEGAVDGVPFYFRARYQHWSMSIGKNPICISADGDVDPCSVYEQCLGRSVRGHQNGLAFSGRVYPEAGGHMMAYNSVRVPKDVVLKYPACGGTVGDFQTQDRDPYYGTVDYFMTVSFYAFCRGCEKFVEFKRKGMRVPFSEYACRALSSLEMEERSKVPLEEEGEVK